MCACACSCVTAWTLDFSGGEGRGEGVRCCQRKDGDPGLADRSMEGGLSLLLLALGFPTHTSSRARPTVRREDWDGATTKTTRARACQLTSRLSLAPSLLGFEKLTCCVVSCRVLPRTPLLPPTGNIAWKNPALSRAQKKSWTACRKGHIKFTVCSQLRVNSGPLRTEIWLVRGVFFKRSSTQRFDERARKRETEGRARFPRTPRRKCWRREERGSPASRCRAPCRLSGGLAA